MKIISYSIVHYGKDYLPWAIKSIYDEVDEIFIVYTPHPSHGHQTDYSPIETKEEILKASFEHDPDNKVRWVETDKFFYEGQHRDYAVRLCEKAGADLILVLDCDEIWNQEVLHNALNFARSEDKARNWLVNFVHLWRSFSWCCRDEGWPVRIIDTRHKEGLAYIPKETGEIFHFGYAVWPGVMKYKSRIHGHRDEWRHQWYDGKFNVWPPPPDCHPTNERDFWTPEPFDKNLLPEFMKKHPYWDMEPI